MTSRAGGYPLWDGEAVSDAETCDPVGWRVAEGLKAPV